MVNEPSTTVIYLLGVRNVIVLLTQTATVAIFRVIVVRMKGGGVVHLNFYELTIHFHFFANTLFRNIKVTQKKKKPYTAGGVTM